MSFLPYCLNTLWMAKCRREWRAFRRAIHDPETTQSEVLRNLLRANADAEFGRRYNFASIRSPHEFRRRVPLCTWDSIAEDVQRIADGEPRVLTAEPVRLLEPTSGSTSGRKLIPYTDSLHREFQRMVAAWIYDLFRHRPAVRRGRAYWSISPAMGGNERTAGNIPVGFDDDTAYLGGLERLLMRRLLAVPPDVARITDVDEFRYATLFNLLKAGNLSLVSVWSPTFLTTLLGRLDEWTDRLCADFEKQRGRLDRAKHVRRTLQSSHLLPDKLRLLWPNLALISCWADAAAASYLPPLQRLFPRVEIQPKGLLATEGCVSFPLAGRIGAAVALRSHFFEFEEPDPETTDKSPRTRLVHELETGGEYSAVLTTGGGLYRYRLGDVVKVVGFEDRCPLVTFLGRIGCTSDLVGEKLSEPFVRRSLDAVFGELGITPRFALVVPVVSHRPGYRLYLQLEQNSDRAAACVERVTTRLQRRLEENPHYRHAIRLGQLRPVDVRLLNPGAESGWRLLERRHLDEGIKAGDVKPTALDARSGWETVFEPAVQPLDADSAEPATSATARFAHRG